MTFSEVITQLKLLSSPDHFDKLRHFGINDSKALGIKIPLLRLLAKKIGKNHDLATELWYSEIHEARILATMIEDPTKITENQLDKWVADFDSWDICDSSTTLFGKTPYIYSKIFEFASSEEVYVKRFAFATICQQAIHNKKLSNEAFIPLLSLIERESWDNRNFVKKAVNWALRQIGKRNEILRLEALKTANQIYNQGSKSAKWIANDAIRELNNPTIIKRIKTK